MLPETARPFEGPVVFENVPNVVAPLTEKVAPGAVVPIPTLFGEVTGKVAAPAVLIWALPIISSVFNGVVVPIPREPVEVKARALPAVPIWNSWDGTEVPIPTEPSTTKPLVGTVAPAQVPEKSPAPMTDNALFAVVVPIPMLP